MSSVGSYRCYCYFLFTVDGLMHRFCRCWSGPADPVQLRLLFDPVPQSPDRDVLEFPSRLLLPLGLGPVHSTQRGIAIAMHHRRQHERRCVIITIRTACPSSVQLQLQLPPTGQRTARDAIRRNISSLGILNVPRLLIDPAQPCRPSGSSAALSRS